MYVYVVSAEREILLYNFFPTQICLEQGIMFSNSYLFTKQEFKTTDQNYNYLLILLDTLN